MRTCPICSGEVTGKSTKVFCGERCRSSSWAVNNRERFNARHRKLYHSNLEQSRANQRAKYVRLKVQKLAYSKIWKASNRDKCRGYNVKAKLRRRAIIAGVDIGSIRVISTWWNKVRSRSTAVCYWCRDRVSTKTIQCEHIIAISRGGAHDIRNLCASCPDCNHSKHVKPLAEWNQKIKEPVLL